MSDHRPSVSKKVQDVPREGWDDPTRGDATWFTLFSAGVTPTTGMCAGVMEIAPHGRGLLPHRHRQAEIYYVIEGAGVVTIDDVETVMAPGGATFVQGHAEHAVRNTGESVLKIFYVFPADSFSDVIYEFPAAMG